MGSLVLVLLAALGCGGPSAAPSPPTPSTPPPTPAAVAGAHGATVVVSAPATVHARVEARTMEVATTLVVRNVDPTDALTLASVRYHGSEGEVLDELLPQPRTLAPMATATFVVADTDTRGGVGASFAVTWASEADVVDPTVETIAIGTRGGLGVSFVHEGRVVDRR